MRVSAAHRIKHAVDGEARGDLVFDEPAALAVVQGLVGRQQRTRDAAQHGGAVEASGAEHGHGYADAAQRNKAVVTGWDGQHGRDDALGHARAHVHLLPRAVVAGRLKGIRSAAVTDAPHDTSTPLVGWRRRGLWRGGAGSRARRRGDLVVGCAVGGSAALG